MEFEGIVYRILPAVKGQGARGEWTKQEVVFELPGEFSRKVCVSFWGDKVQEIASLREGEHASVSINLESREYNGRWFTEARAWKVGRKQAEPAPAYGAPADPYGAPAYSAPSAGASQLPPMPSSAEEVDDLPF